MELLISIWIVCFIILVARQYWSRVVTVSKKVADWLFDRGPLYYGWFLLGFPLIAIPVLLILGLDASGLTTIGIWYLAIMAVSVMFYVSWNSYDGG